MSDQPETFTLERLPSPIGELTVATDEQGRMRILDFEDHEARTERLLARQYGPGAVRLAEGRVATPVRQAIEAYFDGDLGAIEALPVKAGGTAFQREVWTALREIPIGTTLSYGALAQKIGRPAAVRAVGLANGANPIGIVVPCHRVIGADASLTGYAGGVERKQWLLTHEGVNLPAPRARRETAPLLL